MQGRLDRPCRYCGGTSLFCCGAMLEVDTLCRTVNETAKDLLNLEFEIQRLRLKMGPEATQAVKEQAAIQLTGYSAVLLRLAATLEGRPWTFRPVETAPFMR